MSRVWYTVVLLGVAAALVWTLNPSDAKEKKNPSVKEIMDRLHKGGDSLLQKLGDELTSDDPNWASIQKQTKEFVELGTALGKDRPRKGSQESWNKLTAEYLASAKAMDGAARNKEKTEALAAHKKLSNSCMACHRVHKGTYGALDGQRYPGAAE